MADMRAAPFLPLPALLLGAACAGPVPAAPCAPPSALQEIVWEQDCNGCPQGLRLRFGRDGQALLTATGKARLRTTDRVQPARLAPADFERLAAELAEAGLFRLAGRHEEPGLADGRWTQWQARCDSGVHTVFRREDAGPPELNRLDGIVEAWRRRLWPGS